MSEQQRSGKIITFYSYKGGTGRSMALANVAWTLASNGKRVLAIDWDLEAPGLHRYFEPFLIDPDLFSSEGIIDFVWDVSTSALTPEDDTTSQEFPSSMAQPELTDYVLRLDWDFPGDGLLDLIPAGRQCSSYAERVNGFDWDNFYERLGGGRVLQAARERLREEYDYVLIDSRTGVSDTSGICTIQLPDALVVLFTLNKQSTRGAEAVATSVRAQREDIPIFPVPTRIDPFEQEKLRVRLREARRLFAPFLEHQSLDPHEYWGNVELPYVPYYAYEEVLAPVLDEPGRKATILAATVELASYISGEPIRHPPPIPEDARRNLLVRFASSGGATPPGAAATSSAPSGPPERRSASSSAPESAMLAGSRSPEWTSASSSAPAPAMSPASESPEWSGASSSAMPPSMSAAPAPRGRPRRMARSALLALVIGLLVVVGGVAYLFLPTAATSERDALMFAVLSEAGGDVALKRQYVLELYHEGKEFSGVDLRGVDLSRERLEKIKLPNANLRGAKLIGTALDSADLSGAQLDSADLTSARLVAANLAGATMVGTDLSGADLFRANLSNVGLDSTRTTSQTVLSDSTPGPYRRDEDLGAQQENPGDLVQDRRNRGYIWIGNYSRKLGRWEKAQLASLDMQAVTADPQLLETNARYLVRGNMTLRAMQPSQDSSYFKDVVSLGTIPRGSVVTVLGQPQAFERSEAVTQYWVEVAVTEAPSSR
jgi:cellulose biosynthesis protein BcsQ